ncbi:FAD:protein FMN transferase [Oenococcus oeni]|uniref:FAD:protein FMN transferase n=4 Tax=Lactobacillales TaxID=186826 RepID=A0A483B9Z3_OENOE|nr:FAD:protein FMN transferase [Oenococcus oeni]AZZ61233.1 FAD:protein FMN transferase [Oenococcus sp. UCMA 16435]EAV39482.1 thiamine biosynthesis lipoprotein precursor [Oenococcus oeni ATCC BAA-1163]KGH60504.1 thiamine biosynthesis protein [Oenococcus oeni IOEB_9805]KGH64188.1 thiamine biosynthesis protein [Oenococcus oeni S13]KGH77439.1 thiamine biosynthesis protein [Oenococcus oeni IOEB_9304]KGH79385.1 thiamine biosynthesis protein [Oenococcus oeni IOEB_8417]
MMKIYKKNIDHYIMLSFEINEMNIPFTGQIVVKEDDEVTREVILGRAKKIHEWLVLVDHIFSPFRTNSELTLYNHRKIEMTGTNLLFQEVFALSIWAKEMTQGLFSANFVGKYNPTGAVKGWAIEKAERIQLAPLLSDPNFVAVNLNGGGDMQFSSSDKHNWQWEIGIVNPFDNKKVISCFRMKNGAIATSGTSQRGEHLFNSSTGRAIPEKNFNVISSSVIGSELTYSDIWATAIATTTINDHSWLKRLSGSGLRISYNKKSERWLNHEIIDQKELIYA